jgi:mono/diheme cytochrome c family protein
MWRKQAKLSRMVMVAMVLGASCVGLALAGEEQDSIDPASRPATAPENVVRGRAMASMLCFACHADPSTGVLSGREIHDVPPDLACRAFAPNITRHPTRGIGSWSEKQLAYFLRTGCDPWGCLSPPWMPRLTHMADSDLSDLIAFLRSDDPAVAPSPIVQPGVQLTRRGRLASRFVFKSSPAGRGPAVPPPIEDKVAYGRYVVQGKAHCYVCHSADFRGLNDWDPSWSQGYLGGGNVLYDLNGAPIYAPNITAEPKTGIGTWTEDQFVRAVYEGLHPGGHALRYPMLPYMELSDAEVRAVFAYLQTVPKIYNSVRTPPPARPRQVSADTDRNTSLQRGAELYVFYSCRSCHGTTGVGLGDLTHANQKYPRNEELEAWIRNPMKIKPGTKMPTFENVIKPDEYDPLMSYIRQLARQAGR